jgi:hypothetical protein
MATALSSSTKTVLSYESDQNQREQFRYFENDHIEETYQRGNEELQLNDVFDKKVVIENEHSNEEKPLQREEANLSGYARAERFSYPERANLKTFQTSKKLSFLDHWSSKNENITQDYPAVAELAAQGKRLVNSLDYAQN